MRDLEFKIKKCNRCNLSERRKNPIVGQGNRNRSSKILVLMDYITEEEDKTGVLLVDKPGKMLKLLFKYSGLDEVNAYFTTLTKCAAGGSAISEENIDICSEYLIGQIALINPQYIISVGEMATRKLLCANKQAELKFNFKETICKNQRYKGDIIVVPIYDKFYLLKNATDEEKWEVIKKFEEIRKELTE